MDVANILCFFLFVLRSKVFSEKVRKPAYKKYKALVKLSL